MIKIFSKILSSILTLFTGTKIHEQVTAGLPMFPGDTTTNTVIPVLPIIKFNNWIKVIVLSPLLLIVLGVAGLTIYHKFIEKSKVRAKSLVISLLLSILTLILACISLGEYENMVDLYQNYRVPLGDNFLTLFIVFSLVSFVGTIVSIIIGRKLYRK